MIKICHRLIMLKLLIVLNRAEPVVLLLEWMESDRIFLSWSPTTARTIR